MKKFLVEDWVVILLSLPVLILCSFAYYLPSGGPAIPATLLTQSAWLNIGYLFLIALALLYIGNRLLSRPLKGLFWSFVVVFAISILAQVISNIPFIKRFGFKLEETMAFGDGGNDIGMLRHAGIGVAMGNANDEVKAAADYITASVDEDGIYKALKHFGVI